MFALKSGVDVSGLRIQMMMAILVAQCIYDEEGVDLIITSANDSHHSLTSLHYDGAAIDIRTRELTEGRGPEVARILKSWLNKDYDVLFEGDHIHVEWQPRRR